MFREDASLWGWSWSSVLLLPGGGAGARAESPLCLEVPLSQSTAIHGVSGRTASPEVLTRPELSKTPPP